ncbi:unnamed protein product [Zymoseptoria tritici ST99CH_1A5]|uniref:RRM domain-containing protein n=1 Tax=Zymoseptoria tritici ST99CH_1A5 TaxID=1276529 RepID=A0A1Y6LX88_ZYMTR|nr:unnamed protein product [Zymoseptoria tritici ST99CH_1A5]
MSTSSGSSTQRATGPYLLGIEGLPRRYTWQDLKDLIRKQATHNCWTEMAVLSNGQSDGKGAARVPKADEATKLFNYLAQTLVENSPLVVHMWNIGGPIAIMTRCNCGGASQVHRSNDESARVSAMAVDPRWQNFTPTSPLAGTGRSYPLVQAQAQAGTYPSQFMASAQRNNMPVDTTQVTLAMRGVQIGPRASQAAQQQMYQARSTQQYPRDQQQQRQPAQIPMYAANATGTPINISQGIVRTECRGVFVNGLSFKASTKDIEKHFARAGPIVKVDLQRDTQSGRSKGNCTIQYVNADSVAAAIAIFNGQEFWGMPLNVRRDKEATPVNVPITTSNARSRAGRTTTEPIIVNGSQPRKDSVLSCR